MTSQQTTDPQKTLRATFARFMDGLPAENVVAELTGMGASQETAQEIVARAVEILGDPRVRELVASIGRDGTSAADAWGALVSSGVDRDAAQAIVAEVIERRGRIEQKHQLVEDDWRRRKRESNLDGVRSLRKSGWGMIIFGGVLVVPASLVAGVVLANDMRGRRPSTLLLILAVVGIICIAIGIFRLRNANAVETSQRRIDGGGG